MNSGNFAYECMLALYSVLGLWSIAKFHLSTKFAKRFLMLSGTCEANSFIFSFSVFVRKSLVDVIGTSKGKGFQGVVKRHGFGGVGQSTHGQDDRARKPGSIGACSYPAKVFKGMRMGGQMGGDRVTTQNLQVLKVIPEQNLLIVKGSFAGCKGSTVLIEK